MQKQMVQKSTIASKIRVAFFTTALVGLIGGAAVVQAASCTSTADCQAQIGNITNQNNQAQASINDLQNQAGSYQDAIGKLQAQISELQGQINANEAQKAQLDQKIAAYQQQITLKKGQLGATLKSMYIDGQTTSIEQLATSKNLSDYVDKEEYHNTVQAKLDDTIKEVTALQNQMQTSKKQVEQLLASQKVQSDQIAAAQAQQNQLLSYNQSQQDGYNKQLASNKAELAQLYAKQAAIIAASFRSSGGIQYGGSSSYPYNAAVANGEIYTWLLNGREYDPAGWSYRNCTSYAFWRLAQTSGITITAGYFPQVRNSGGRIKYSVLGGDFANQGYRVDHDPNGAAVLAVNTLGDYGHIMYVESVSGGMANVSQYNAEGRGLYSTGRIAPASNIWFIHIR